MSQFPWIIIVFMSATHADFSFKSERGFATQRDCKDVIRDIWKQTRGSRFIDLRCVRIDD